MNVLQNLFAMTFVVGLSVSVLAGDSLRAVSVADSRIQPSIAGSGDSTAAALSADGRYVAFTSSANNLVTNDNNGLTLDVFIRDRQEGVTSLMSVSADGARSGDGHSVGPWLSADGRIVLFESKANNLVSNPTIGQGDIFARDVVSGVTTLVSVSQDGTWGGNGPSTGASITPDGRYVVFESAASDLVPEDSNGQTDVFVRDLQTSKTTLVSVNYLGTGSASAPGGFVDASSSPAISSDGKSVAFVSIATNLVEGCTNRFTDVYVRDLVTGTTKLVSANLAGTPASGVSGAPLLSADGRYVVFESYAADIVSPAPTGASMGQIYWRDLQTGLTALASKATNDSASQASISAHGLLVAYCQGYQVYVWDSQTDTTVLASAGPDGELGDGLSDTPMLSDDGTKVAFLSAASNLADIPNAYRFQVFVRDLVAGTTTLASVGSDGVSASEADCLFPVFSADGRVVAFDSLDGNLVLDDSNGATDIFVRDMTGVQVEIASRRDAGLVPFTASGFSDLATGGISADGAYVLFSSIAENLVLGDANGCSDVFLHDVRQGVNTLISVNKTGTASAAWNSHDAVMTPDARFVAFLSTAADLADKDLNSADDVYVRDVVAGTTTLASINRAANAASGVSSIPPLLSADGRYVAFMSRATDLVPMDGNGREDIFLRDLGQGRTVALTLAIPTSFRGSFRPLLVLPGPKAFFTAGTNVYLFDETGRTNLVATGAYGRPAITPDGRFAAYRDFHMRNLNTWFADLQTGTQTKLTKTIHTFPAAPPADVLEVAITPDGRYVAFVDASDSLVPGDSNGAKDVLLADTHNPGSLTLVSVNAAGTASGNGHSSAPSISDDGRFVSFLSLASNLAPGDNNQARDAFVRDMRLGITRLVSMSPSGGVAGSGITFASSVSANGQEVAFASWAFDLVMGDYNAGPDVFVYDVPQEGSADSDADGMLDAWEVVRFGDLSHDGKADTDGDGPTDLQEYLAGTNPVDAESCLRLALVGAPSLTQGALLGWKAAVNRHYRVQYKNTLSDPAWSDLVAEQVLLSDGSMSVQDAGASLAGCRFYRLVVE